MPSTDTDRSSDTSSGTRRRVLVGLGVLVAAAVAWLAWSFLGPAPDEVSIDDAVAGAQTSAGTSTSEGTSDDDASSGDDASATTTTTADGTTWTVDTSIGSFSVADTSGTFVGFRVDEELSSIGATTAIGRTPGVEGSVTVDGSTLAAATITADLTQVESDESRRENAIQGALGTSSNPDATFELTEPVDLGSEPAAGDQFSVDATGDLTVNGVTQTVTIPLDAAWTDDGVVVVTGSVDVLLSDYDVEAPSAPIVVSVADTATVELQVYLTQ